MPRRAINEAVEAQLDLSGAARFVDLRVDILDEATNKVLFTGGGRWDRRKKRYAAPSKKSKILRLHVGQLEAGRWFSEWLRGHRVGKVMQEADGRRIWSVCLISGRRAGKSDLAFKLAIAFAVAIPASITWIVCPGFPDVPEVERELELILPKKWYRAVGKPEFRYTLVNGSTIFLKSQHDPEDVRRGRCDLAIMNEAQKQNEATFGILRPATSDHGGLVVMTANPPKMARGQWVAEYAANAEAGYKIDKKGARHRFHGKVFRLDARKNPHVSNESLLEMEGEISEREYRIEIKGEILPPTNTVLHAWSEYNRVPVPDTGDITRRALMKRLGSGYEYERFVGLDFQRSPHMAGAAGRLFVDVDNMNDDLLWYENEIVVENGDENDLVDAMEELGYDPKRTALIVDASGEWQDADRTRGRASCDVLRRRGWRHIYLPDAKMRKNPLIEERVLVANARICDSTGKRHIFVDPRCLQIDEAARKWENRNGRPSRTSDFAHLGDCITYPPHRLYPRRHLAGKFESRTAARGARPGLEMLDGRPSDDPYSMDE